METVSSVDTTAILENSRARYCLLDSEELGINNNNKDKALVDISQKVDTRHKFNPRQEINQEKLQTAIDRVDILQIGGLIDLKSDVNKAFITFTDPFRNYLRAQEPLATADQLLSAYGRYVDFLRDIPVAVNFASQLRKPEAFVRYSIAMGIELSSTK